MQLVIGDFTVTMDKEFDSLLLHKWYIQHGYVARIDGRKTIFLHRCVMGLVDAKGALVVHHRDGNKLDNRKSNLQIMTNTQHTRIENAKAKDCMVEWAISNHIKNYENMDYHQLLVLRNKLSRLY